MEWIALVFFWLAQQCRVVTEIANNRPDGWRFSDKWLDKTCGIRIGAWKLYICSPYKWLSWGIWWFTALGVLQAAYYGNPIFAGLVAVPSLAVAILTFDFYYHWLYMKPDWRTGWFGFGGDNSDRPASEAITFYHTMWVAEKEKREVYQHEVNRLRQRLTEQRRA